MYNTIVYDKNRITFYLAIGYILIEFLRPQEMYSPLAALPIGKIVSLLFLIYFIIEGRQYLISSNINKGIVLFCIIVFISVIFALDVYKAWDAATEFYKWILLYFLIVNTINDKHRLYIFVIVLLACYFKLGQFAVRKWVSNGFHFDHRGMYVGAGFLSNPDDMGAGINTIFGVAAFMIAADRGKKWWGKFRAIWFHIPVTFSFIIIVLVTGSRGAALALGTNLLAIIMKTKKKFLLLPLIVLVGFGFWFVTPETNKARFESMGSKEDRTSQSRLTLWGYALEMVENRPFTGIGIGNFLDACEVYQCPIKQVQHNIFVQAASDLGVPGLLALLLLFYLTFSSNRQVRKILKREDQDPFLWNLSLGLDVGLVGFAAAGFFITVLFYPFFWVHLMMCTALRGAVEKEYEQQAG